VLSIVAEICVMNCAIPSTGYVVVQGVVGGLGLGMQELATPGHQSVGHGEQLVEEVDVEEVKHASE